VPAAAKQDSSRGNTVALRLGFNTLLGMAAAHVERIERAQQEGPFRSVDDIARRTGLSRAALTRLAKAGTFGSLGLDRRTALWEALGEDQKELPLFDRRVRETHQPGEPVRFTHPMFLPAMSAAEEVLADYRTAGLSLRAHPLAFLRARLERRRVVPAESLKTLPHGRPVSVAGIVLVRQRPSAAKGITFVTLEDETGAANAIVRPGLFEKARLVINLEPALIITGRVQNEQGVVHVMASEIAALPHPELPAQSSHDFR